METGRVNQKRRTRAAIVAAGRELLAQGTAPTVAQAAELALVSRTTAYRYFPTQESLLVELTMTSDVDEVEEIVARPVGDQAAADRVLEVLDVFNRHVAAAEVEYRTALRLYLGQWLDAVAEGDPPPVMREGRRTRWLQESLDPVADRVPSAELERLVAALSVLTGVEARVVLRDVCRRSDDEGREVLAWAARTLLDATLGARTDTGADTAAGEPADSPAPGGRSRS